MALVRPLRLPSVQFWSLVVVRVAASRGSVAVELPLGVKVKCKFWSEKSCTGSLNVMGIEAAGINPDDGAVIVTVGEVVSTIKSVAVVLKATIPDVLTPATTRS